MSIWRRPAVADSPDEGEELIANTLESNEDFSSGGRGARRRRQLSFIGTPVAFLLLFTCFYGVWLGPVFLNATDRLFDVYSNSPQLIVSLGLMVCLISGQFDLSVAALATLVCVLVMQLGTETSLPFALVLILCLGAGVAAGSLNGLIVCRFRINPFIATLGTGGVFDGLADVISHDEPVPNGTTVHSLPSWFSGINSFGSFLEKAPWAADWVIVVLLGLAAFAVIRENYAERPNRMRSGLLLVLDVIMCVALGLLLVGRANWSILLVFVIALIIWSGLRYTVFGRNLHGVGGNQVAALFAGIRVKRHMFGSFVIAGVCAAIAGIVLAASQGSATPGIADSYLLPAYAGVFLSTVIFSSGRFHVWGTLIGVLSLVYVSEGLIDGGISVTWTPFINGLVLIAVVSASTLLRRTNE
jgi:ribose/xylose/arabinose/galactoside ABC-type transport system permease subunit